MKFRIAYRGGKYYPQVKPGWLRPWMRIGEHSEGYGLYSDLQYGVETYREAKIVCALYNLSFESNKTEVQYFKVEFE